MRSEEGKRPSLRKGRHENSGGSNIAEGQNPKTYAEISVQKGKLELDSAGPCIPGPVLST